MKKIFLFLFLLLIASSCVKLSSFNISGKPSVEVRAVTASGVYCNLICDILNSGRKVTINEYELFVKSKDGNVILTISADKDIVIDRGENSRLAVPLNIKMEGGVLGFITIGSQLKQPGVYVDGYVKGRAPFKKRIDIKPIPLKALESLIDINSLNLNL